MSDSCDGRAIRIEQLMAFENEKVKRWVRVISLDEESILLLVFERSISDASEKRHGRANLYLVDGQRLRHLDGFLKYKPRDSSEESGAYRWLGELQNEFSCADEILLDFINSVPYFDAVPREKLSTPHSQKYQGCSEDKMLSYIVTKDNNSLTLQAEYYFNRQQKKIAMVIEAPSKGGEKNDSEKSVESDSNRENLFFASQKEEDCAVVMTA